MKKAIQIILLLIAVNLFTGCAELLTATQSTLMAQQGKTCMGYTCTWFLKNDSGDWVIDRRRILDRQGNNVESAELRWLNERSRLYTSYRRIDTYMETSPHSNYQYKFAVLCQFYR